MTELPMKGVRVIDLTLVWAGPYATALLADLGAEVIRIESSNYFPYLTRGSVVWPTQQHIDTRDGWWGCLPGRQPGSRPWNQWPTFNSHARNKLSMTVNLRSSPGMDIFHRLLKVSDVFLENNVPETIEKLGLTYEKLARVNPSIIMISMPGFGNSGPYKNYRALGTINEDVAGHNLLRGYSDMDPTSLTSAFTADVAAGANAAFAVLAALHYRRRTGRGQHIELSQVENFLPYLGEAFMDYAMNGRVGTTLGNRHPYALQGCYPCRGEDRWVNISIFDDNHWQAFCRVLGSPDWTQLPQFATHQGRRDHHDELDRYIEEWTRQQDPYQVMQVLQEAGVPAGVVMNQRDAYEDPHVAARGFFQEAYQEDCGTHLYPGAPFRMSETNPTITRGPVRMGEDNEYVYKTLLKVSDEEYDTLVEAGHITMDYPPDTQ